jgi:hypothetical protein
MSQFTAADLQGLIVATGIKVAGVNNMVTGAFVSPLVNAWSTLVKGLNKHIINDGTRLFLTGHSWAVPTQLCLRSFWPRPRKVEPYRLCQKFQVFTWFPLAHPHCSSDTARNTFNRHLDSGLITLDRVVSQKIAARSAATQMLVGGIGGPNDVIPNIPAGFTHPGYKASSYKY